MKVDNGNDTAWGLVYVIHLSVADEENHTKSLKLFSHAFFMPQQKENHFNVQQFLNLFGPQIP